MGTIRTRTTDCARSLSCCFGPCNPVLCMVVVSWKAKKNCVRWWNRKAQTHTETEKEEACGVKRLKTKNTLLLWKKKKWIVRKNKNKNENQNENFSKIKKKKKKKNSPDFFVLSFLFFFFWVWQLAWNLCHRSSIHDCSRVATFVICIPLSVYLSPAGSRNAVTDIFTNRLTQSHTQWHTFLSLSNSLLSMGPCLEYKL